MLVFLDESLRRHRKTGREFGVLAGVAIPEDTFHDFQYDFHQVHRPYHGTGLLQNAASLVVYPLGSGIEARKYENYASTGSAFPGKLYLTWPPLETGNGENAKVQTEESFKKVTRSKATNCCERQH